MLLELDKKDLKNLVLGTSPYYSVFDEPLVKRCGTFCGGFVERWDWRESALDELTEKELYELYLICKNS